MAAKLKYENLSASFAKKIKHLNATIDDLKESLETARYEMGDMDAYITNIPVRSCSGLLLGLYALGGCVHINRKAKDRLGAMVVRSGIRKQHRTNCAVVLANKTKQN